MNSPTNREFALRASSLPLAFRCPGSVQPSKLLIDTAYDAADDGTAAHEALQAVARGEGVPWDRLEGISAAHGANADEVKMLVAMGAKLWDKTKDSFPDASTEVYLEQELSRDGVTVFLSGHKDVLSITGDVARAADWKTGRKDSNHSQQMRGYAALILLDNPDLVEVTVTILWVRDDDIENYTMRRADLERWLDDLFERVVGWDGTYRVGRHCQHCKRSAECEARAAMARRDVSAFLRDGGTFSLADLSSDQKVDLYHKAKLVHAYAESYVGLLREDIAEHGEVAANGTTLRVREENQPQVSPLEAWPLLEAAGFQDEDLAACVKIGTTAMKKRMARLAGRGKGAPAVRKLMADLQDAGAVTYTTVTKIEERRT